jgi:hypothetical protein
LVGENEILTTNDLDFTIEKKPMLIGVEGSLIPKSTGYFGLLNTKTNEVINAVREGYTVSQNDEIVLAAVMGIQPFENTLSVSKAGSINGGRKVFIQLEMKGVNVYNDDAIKRYITIIDSNDGSTGLAVGIGTLTMSCQNQFWHFYKSAQMKARHTVSLVDKIKKLPALITEAMEQSLELNEQFKRMYKIQANQKVIDALVNNLVGADRTMSEEQIKELSTRKVNAMNSLYKHINSEMSTKGQNLWGLHSGVTSWTTHEKSHPKRENGHIESLMIGTNQKTASKALTFLEEYIESEELVSVS